MPYNILIEIVLLLLLHCGGVPTYSDILGEERWYAELK